MPLIREIFDAMVSSTCSSASIESAPAGFLGFTADGAVDAVTDVRNSLVLMQRPLSVEVGYGDGASYTCMDLQLKGALPLLTSSNSQWHHLVNRDRNKKSAHPKLSSISRRGRYDSAFRLMSDYYPLPRWRPLRSRRNSAQYSGIDLRQLSENLKQFERQNRRRSVIRFFDC